MEYRTMLLLYDINQERREAILKGQQHSQLVRRASRAADVTRQCADWLIGLGLARQRSSQAVEPHTPSTQSAWTATLAGIASKQVNHDPSGSLCRVRSHFAALCQQLNPRQ